METKTKVKEKVIGFFGTRERRRKEIISEDEREDKRWKK